MLVVLYDHSKGSGIIPSWLPQHLDKSKSPGISFTIHQVYEERVCIFSTDNVFCISISTCVSVSSDGREEKSLRVRPQVAASSATKFDLVIIVIAIISFIIIVIIISIIILIIIVIVVIIAFIIIIIIISTINFVTIRKSVGPGSQLIIIILIIIIIIIIMIIIIIIIIVIIIFTIRKSVGPGSQLSVDLERGIVLIKVFKF